MNFHARYLLLGAALLTPSSALAQRTLGIDFAGDLYTIDFATLQVAPFGASGLVTPEGLVQTAANELLVTTLSADVFRLELGTLGTTPVGPAQPALIDLTVEEDLGRFCGSSGDSLYRLNPTDVSLSLIGPYGGGAYITSLDYHRSSGVFVGIEGHTDSFCRIDPVTGQALVVGPVGVANISAIWFDEGSGRTFGLTHAPLGQLVEFDASTGQATVLAQTGVDWSALGGVVPSPLGTNFCTALPNSSGAPGHLSGSGSTSLTVASLTLTASSVPNSPGVMFFGGTVTAGTPFGDGVMCAGFPFLRLRPTIVGVAGQASLTVDFAALGASPSQIIYLQYWFRDGGFGPAGYNLSDGLRVVFTP